jgi:hypothetical protein
MFLANCSMTYIYVSIKKEKRLYNGPEFQMFNYSDGIPKWPISLAPLDWYVLHAEGSQSEMWLYKNQGIQKCKNLNFEILIFHATF